MPDACLRRVKLRACDGQGKALVFTIAPSAVMPYMTGYTDEVEKPLFLRCFGVPFWAFSRVFGRNDRIGAKHDEVCGFNFLPETELGRNLGLHQKLRRRI